MPSTLKLLSLAVLVLSSAKVDAQFSISLSCDIFGNASVNLDSSSGGPLQGWALAVCHDSAAIGLISVADGAATATVGAGGGPPAFDTINTFPDGWTVTVVIDFLGCCTLAPGNHELNVMQYDVSSIASGDTTDLCFCSGTLGSPPVAIVVAESGSLIPPAGLDSCCTVAPPFHPDWFYLASNENVAAPPGSTASATVSFSIEPFYGSPGFDTQGFSMGWSASGGTNVSVADPVPVNDLAGINGGTGPSFFGVSNFGADWTVGVVYNFLGGVFIQYSPGSAPVCEAVYSFDGVTDVITISVDDTLGSPPVSNVVVLSGASFAAAGLNPGTITVSVLCESLFIRGDCNDDHIVNLADAVWLLSELFLSGPPSSCPDACDADGDSMVDATDATYILNYRFLDGPPPAPPFPDCGAAADCLTCQHSCG